MARIEVELDEFTDTDLLNEIEGRTKRGYDKKNSLKLLQELRKRFDIRAVDIDDTKISLADQMKLDYFKENFDKITEQDLINIVNKQP